MAVTLKHAFTNAIADDPVAAAAGEVLPSHWNANHTLTLATDTLLGRSSAGTGAAEEVPCTAFARTLLDDADAATARTTLGVPFVQRVTTQSTTTATTTAVIPFDNTKPQNTEGTAFASLDTTITPKAAGNTLRVSVCLAVVAGATIIDFTLAVFRDAGVDAVFAKVLTTTNNNYHMEFNFAFEVAAGSTSATTFKIRYGASAANTVYINRTALTTNYYNGLLSSSMTVEEYTP